jgi:hypothetical protein
MNQTDFWPNRSLLNAIINDEVGVRFPDAPEADNTPSPMGKNGGAPSQNSNREVTSGGPASDAGEPLENVLQASGTAGDPVASGNFGDNSEPTARSFNAPGELESLGGARASSDPVTAELEAYLEELRNQTSPFAEAEEFFARGSFGSDLQEIGGADEASTDGTPLASDTNAVDGELPQFEGFFLHGSGPLAFFPAIWNMPMSFFNPEYWATSTPDELEEYETELTEVGVELDN